MASTCPVCDGTKVAPSHNPCGCCEATGTISEERLAIKRKIARDIMRRLANAEVRYDRS